MQLDCARNCRHGDSIIAILLLSTLSTLSPPLPPGLMDDGEDSACKLVTGLELSRSGTGGVCVFAEGDAIALALQFVEN